MVDWLSEFSLGNSAAKSASYSPGKFSSCSFNLLGLRRFVMATGGTPPSSSGISDAQLETLMATMRQGMKDELTVMKRELSARGKQLTKSS